MFCSDLSWIFWIIFQNFRKRNLTDGERNLFYYLLYGSDLLITFVFYTSIHKKKYLFLFAMQWNVLVAKMKD